MPGEDRNLPLEVSVLLFYEGQRSEAELAELVYEATEPCRKIAYNILCCWDLAADIHQEVAIKYIKKIRQREVILNPVGWFSVCMQRRALTELKKRRPRGWVQVGFPPDDLIPAQKLVPADELVFHREVREVVDALPAEARAIVLARARDGATAKEVATLLNRSVGAVQSKYFRTCQVLKATLRPRPLPALKTKASNGDESG